MPTHRIKKALRRLLEPEPANDRPPTAHLPEEFFIKPGYSPRSEPEYYDDSTPAALQKVYQPDVYTLAGTIASMGSRRLVDVGCGRGGKLRPFGEAGFDVVGVDFGPNIDYCRKTYPFGRWLEFDFDAEDGFPLDELDLRDRVIICADVIEHLKTPRPLLVHLKRAVDQGACLLLSTPERELLPRGCPDGPPKNRAHVREWSLGELRALLTDVGLPISLLGLTAATDSTRHMTTSLAILYHLPSRSGTVGDAARS